MKWANSLKDKAHLRRNRQHQQPVSRKEITFVIKSLPTKNTPGPNDFTGNYTKHLKNINFSQTPPES